MPHDPDPGLTFANSISGQEVAAAFKPSPRPDCSQSVTISRDEMEQLRVTMKHARTFITSRQKMNPVGVEQYDESVKRLTALLYEYECAKCGERYHWESQPSYVMKCPCGGEARLIANAEVDAPSGATAERR